MNTSSRTFGSHLDIHSGGLDLVFPHHANEILQSTAFYGIQTWAKYWIHTGTHLHRSFLLLSINVNRFFRFTEHEIDGRENVQILEQHNSYS